MGHRLLLQSTSNQRISPQIEVRQSRVTVVPNLRRQLVSSNEILEFLLVLRALEEQPIGCRITNPVAEHDVQPKRDLVDEVVHVTFQTAVVVAAKHKSLLVVDVNPAREMYRRHAREISSRVDVTRGVLNEPQEGYERPAPEQSRLHTSHRCELIRHVVIFDFRKAPNVLGRRSWRDHGISLFTTPQLNQKDRQIKQKPWQKKQQQHGNENEIQ